MSKKTKILQTGDQNYKSPFVLSSLAILSKYLNVLSQKKLSMSQLASTANTLHNAGVNTTTQKQIPKGSEGGSDVHVEIHTTVGNCYYKPYSMYNLYGIIPPSSAVLHIFFFSDCKQWFCSRRQFKFYFLYNTVHVQDHGSGIFLQISE